jgi:hypothetical protein
MMPKSVAPAIREKITTDKQSQRASVDHGHQHAAFETPVGQHLQENHRGDERPEGERGGTRSFAALGGIPRSGIYENMKTAVDKVQKGNPYTNRGGPLHRSRDPLIFPLAGVCETSIQQRNRREFSHICAAIPIPISQFRGCLP